MMNIVLIGSGNVAHHLGAALQQAGHHIEQVYSRSADHAKSLGDVLKSTTTSTLEDIVSSADLYILAVSDQALPEIVSQLSPALQGIVVHTSGATSMDLLNKWTNHGVIYPPQSLSKEVATDISRIPFAIEGNNKTVTHRLINLVHAIAPLSFEADSDQRMALHVAAVFANNFSNVLYQISFDILTEKKLPIELIRPIILETALKVQQHIPKQVQTGPARRNDEITIQKHLDYLKQHEDWQMIYQILSLIIKKSTI